MRKVFWTIAISLLFCPIPAQSQSADLNEAAVVSAVAELYVSGEPAKLELAFDPATNLYTTNERGGLRIIPFHEYLENVKKNNGSLEPRKGVIQEIDRTGNAATVRITTTTPAAVITDYLSLLRLEGQWKIVSKTFFVDRRTRATPDASSPNPPETNTACGSPDHHIFDFMIGSWTTSDSSVTNVPPAEGMSTGEAMLDNCVIHEHRRITRQGKKLFDGDAYWCYDVTTKHWLLFYFDDASHAQVYEGREEGGHVSFYRERPDSDGKPTLIRITYAPIARGYTQTVERSGDRGGTWLSGGITTYLPKQ
jgi:hypothetical protein